MAENTHNPKNPHQLTDGELEAVTGGIGLWSENYETTYQQEYKNSGSTDTFESWFKNKIIANFSKSGITLSARDLANLDDALKARALWIADGKPAGKTYYCSNGALTYVV